MQVNTDLNGVYSEEWLPSASGNYLVRALWEANMTFPGSRTTINLAVASFEESTVFAVESNSTVSALACYATSKELCFTVSGLNGTYGYARVSIAKSLVDAIAELAISIDGEQLDYTSTSADDAWLLSFTYPHSVHNVVVYMSEVIAHLPSTISCLLPYSIVSMGSVLTVSGMILPTPSLPVGEVTLTYTQSDDTVMNRTVTIGPDGSYGELYAPLIVGEWSVAASWNGDVSLEEAISATRTFTVTTAIAGIPLEYIALGVLGIIIITFVLYKRMS